MDDFVEHDRLAESREIGSRVAATLAPPAKNTLSAEYYATRPKSAMEALRVTPEEQEEVLWHFAVTSSIPKTVIATGLPLNKIRAVIFNPESSATLNEMRSAIRVDVMQKIKDTQVALLDGIQDSDKIDKTPIDVLARVLSEVTTSQVSLVTAEAAARGHAGLIADPTRVFSADDLEYMALLRRKVTNSSGSVQASDGEEPSAEMRGHEMIDPGYRVESTTPSYVDPSVELQEQIDEERSAILDAEIV